jgi:predicted enzyme related to lactoylglutathione lyase
MTAAATGPKTIIYPVRDLTAAKAVFDVLAGGAPDTDEAYYVGYTVDGQQVGLDPNGHAQGMTGPVGFWHVDDIAAVIERVVGAGGEQRSAPRDVGGGRLVATVADSDGNAIGLIQSPW